MRSSWTVAAVIAAAVASLRTPARAQDAPATSVAPSPAASAAGVPPAAEPAGALARPFGPGTIVDVRADKPYVYVFVARGIVEPAAVFPDPFVKVGRAPVQFEVPPGVYTVLAEGEQVPSVHTVFAVQRQPVHVRVDAGSQGLRSAATLGLAIGVVAAAAGLVLEVSRVKGERTRDKRKFSVPLLIGGGVALAGGFTAWWVSGSSVEHDGFVSAPPQQAPRSGFRGVVLARTF